MTARAGYLADSNHWLRFQPEEPAEDNVCTTPFLWSTALAKLQSAEASAMDSFSFVIEPISNKLQIYIFTPCVKAGLT